MSNKANFENIKVEKLKPYSAPSVTLLKMDPESVMGSNTTNIFEASGGLLIS